MYKYVTYISEQSYVLSEKVIEDLLVHSRDTNDSRGITGLLIFFQGVFTQYLEGPEEEIKEVYEKIIKDSRHQRVIELSSGYSDRRYYGDWCMAYHKLSNDEFAKITGYQELDRDQFFTQPGNKVKHPGIELLESFIQGLHFNE